MTITERQRLQRLSDACTNCTAFWIRTATDDDGEPVFFLVDGCGDDYGDAFPDLDELEIFITNNEEVADYLARH